MYKKEYNTSKMCEYTCRKNNVNFSQLLQNTIVEKYIGAI